MKQFQHLNLPIVSILPQVQDKLSASSNLVVQAPPGAGKSTVLPLALLDAPWLQGQKVLMLEPRRLAAKSVASRMASLLGETLGNKVGYAIRFEKVGGANTQIEVVTEGILTRRLQQDNTLEGVGVVIFDEFHERSIHADAGLALCREVQQVLRPELRIIVMSATFDASGIAELIEAPVVKSEGRQYPIEKQYLPQNPQASIPHQAVAGIREALVNFEGDILAFLPGVGEIKWTIGLLEEKNISAKCYPLYGQLGFQEQQQALLPSPDGRRKVVLATSIAETSLTIEGIRVVVDTGWTRKPRYDRSTGFTKLETVQVTKDIADQRAGRAGRLGPGHCIRLWSTLVQQHLEERFPPEISTADLSSLILQLAAWGTQVEDLSWLTSPPAVAVAQAQELLQVLGALDGNGRITAQGKRMASFPAHPRVAKLLLQSKELGLEANACYLSALLEERDPLDRSKVGTDLRLRLQALLESTGKGRQWSRVWKSAEAWLRLMKLNKASSPKLDEFAVGQLLALAYPERIAKQLDPHSIRYQLATGAIVRLPEQDRLTQYPWLVVGSLDLSGHQSQKHADGKAFLAAPVSLDSLDISTEREEEVKWDMETGQLSAYRFEKIGVLEVSREALAEVSEELKQEALGVAIRKQPSWLNWSDDVQRWQERVESLRLWRKEEEWIEASQEALLESLEEWLLPYTTNIKNLSQPKKLNLLDLLPSLMTYEQQQDFSRLVPERVQVPSGSNIRLQYSMEGNPPVLAARLQELFGLTDTPTVNDGRQPVLIHLLSPGYKPVQVTQDLRSFWDNTYTEVRKELRRRYPKHAWPENPWEAQAIRGVPRRRSRGLFHPNLLPNRQGACQTFIQDFELIYR